MTQTSDAARGLTEAEILAGDPEANGVPATAAGESSWAPVDLGACEGIGQAAPTLLPRVDDRCLLYEGRIHELAAPPESGKGWIALAAALEPLQAGYPIVYIDFEGSAAELLERLGALGIPQERITGQVLYRHKGCRLSDHGAAAQRRADADVFGGIGLAASPYLPWAKVILLGQLILSV